jgi:hypothetical protein
MLIAQQDLTTRTNKQIDATAITRVVAMAITFLGFLSQYEHALD